MPPTHRSRARAWLADLTGGGPALPGQRCASPCTSGQCTACGSFCDGCCEGGDACVPAAAVSAERCGAGASGCDPCTVDAFCSAFDAVCKGALDPACSDARGGCGPCAHERRVWAGEPLGHVSMMLDPAGEGLCELVAGDHPGGAIVVQEGGASVTVRFTLTTDALEMGEVCWGGE